MISLPRRIGITEALSASSVQIGDLIIPASTTERVLQKYCKQLFILTGSDQFPYQFYGSGSALEVSGKHFIFCTGHQIDHFQPDTVAIHHGASNHTITASRLVKPIVTKENIDTDWIDARALEYVVENYDIANLAHQFFPISIDNVWPDLDTNNFILFGYPTERQDIDYSIPHITAKRTEVKAKYDGPSNSPHVHRLKMDRKEIFNTDGMSGGPVFYLGENSRKYFIGFAGIIIRGGTASDYIHFLEASFLIQMASK